MATQVEAIVAAILATGMSKGGARETTVVQNYRLVLAELRRTGRIDQKKKPLVDSRDQ
jgi:hypothetical protein